MTIMNAKEEEKVAELSQLNLKTDYAREDDDDDCRDVVVVFCRETLPPSKRQQQQVPVAPSRDSKKPKPASSATTTGVSICTDQGGQNSEKLQSAAPIAGLATQHALTSANSMSADEQQQAGGVTDESDDDDDDDDDDGDVPCAPASSAATTNISICTCQGEENSEQPEESQSGAQPMMAAQPVGAARRTYATNGHASGGVKKPQRYRPGTVAFRDIRKYPKSTTDCAEPFMRKLPFERLVRKIAKDINPNIGFQLSAVVELHAHLAGVIEDYEIVRQHCQRQQGLSVRSVLQKTMQLRNRLT